MDSGQPGPAPLQSAGTKKCEHQDHQTLGKYYAQDPKEKVLKLGRAPLARHPRIPGVGSKEHPNCYASEGRAKQRQQSHPKHWQGEAVDDAVRAGAAQSMQRDLA
jgi:hypothetical protein